jgi:demethoxyubiquinone hydroxylase (CLK1/Coq7/Cat5 family)
MASQLIRRILRVNHAGEHGAVAIYSAQLAKVRRTHPDLVPWLAAMEALIFLSTRGDSLRLINTVAGFG